MQQNYNNERYKEQLIASILAKNGYKMEGFVGEGNFSKCYILSSPKYAVNFVCKVIEFKEGVLRQKYKEIFYHEVNALLNVIHPNIVKIYRYFEEGDFLFLIIEYCKGGNLSDYLRQNKKVSSGNLLISFTRQIVSALSTCHKAKIAHHDIKPANILLDYRGNIKLCDFGFATTEEDKTERFIGSAAYMAPEILEKRPYDPFKADIWALGVTIYQLAKGEVPFKGRSISSILTEIKLGFSESLINIPLVIRKLIQVCLIIDPEKRYSIDQIEKLVYDHAFDPKPTSLSHNLSSPIKLPKRNSLRRSIKGTISTPNIPATTSRPVLTKRHSVLTYV